MELKISLRKNVASSPTLNNARARNINQFDTKPNRSYLPIQVTLNNPAKRVFTAQTYKIFCFQRHKTYYFTIHSANKRKLVDNSFKKYALLNETEEVTKLEKWEQKRKKDGLSKLLISLASYLINLTHKLQGKIMNENKGPSINLKNINFINKVEDFDARRKQIALDYIAKDSKVKKNKNIEVNTVAKNWTDKHLYMLGGRIIENFRNAEGVPLKDKRIIEKEFNTELKNLKLRLDEVKETRKRLFAANNEIYFRIETTRREIEVFNKRKNRK